MPERNCNSKRRSAAAKATVLSSKKSDISERNFYCRRATPYSLDRIRQRRMARRRAGCQGSHAAECFQLQQVPSQQAEALILFTFAHSVGSGTRKRSSREVLLRRSSGGWVVCGLRAARLPTRRRLEADRREGMTIVCLC